MPLGEDIQLAECLETGVFLYGGGSQDLSKIQNTTSKAGQQTLKICIKRLLPGFPSAVPWMCPGPSTEPGGWAATARTPIQAGVQFRCPSRTTRTLKSYFSSLSHGLLTWRWTPVARVAMWLWWDNDGWCQHCPRSQQWLGARPHTQHRGKHLTPLYNGAYFTHKAQRGSESPPSPSSASQPSPSPPSCPPGAALNAHHLSQHHPLAPAPSILRRSPLTLTLEGNGVKKVQGALSPHGSGGGLVLHRHRRWCSRVPPSSGALG